jgi:hypothetical protein
MNIFKGENALVKFNVKDINNANVNIDSLASAKCRMFQGQKTFAEYTYSNAAGSLFRKGNNNFQFELEILKTLTANMKGDIYAEVTVEATNGDFNVEGKMIDKTQILILNVS